jgi:hypothetical protein
MKSLMLLIVCAFMIGCTTKSNNDYKQVDNVELERNLKLTLQEYLDLKLNLEIEKSSIYIHPISWEILKLKFPEEKDIEGIKRKIAELFQSSNIKQMNEEFNMSYNVGSILDTLSFQDERIFILDYERKGENKFDKIYEKSLTIAITENNGDTWKFIGIDEEYLKQIEKLLRNKYPTTIVDRIFKTIKIGLSKENIETSFKPNDNIEKSLEKDFINYYTSFYSGNSEQAMSYLYSGLFEYLKTNSEGNYSIDEVKRIFKETNIDKMKEQVENKNLITSISKILNKVEYKNSLIYVLSYSLRSGNSNDLTSVGGEAIAVSSNYGQNWKFFEKDDESLIPILSTEFPNEIITKVMNYEYKK